MSVMDWTSLVLLAVGVFFLFVAALGVIRLPDLYMRSSATSKASTLGVVFTMLAAAFYFRDLAVSSRALAICVFMFLTAPVAAHMITRAAYLTGARLWKGTTRDQLKGRYNPRTHALSSTPVDEGFDTDDGPASSDGG